MNRKYAIIIAIGAGLLLLAAYLLMGKKGTSEEPGKTDLPEVVAWKRALKKDTDYHYLNYGVQYPRGKYVKDAESKYDEVDPGTIDIEILKSKRFTGHLSQYDDKKVFSLRFNVIDEKEDILYFRAMVNLGAVGKSLNGTIDLSDNIIQFIEIKDGPKMMISDGKVYARDNKIIIESTDLDQYWVLD